MATTEKSLMPYLSAPVERRSLDASALGAEEKNGVVPNFSSSFTCIVNCAGNAECIKKCFR
jgi:hypothetical protein